MSTASVLVLAANRPGDRGIGELLLRDFSRGYPAEKQAYFCIGAVTEDPAAGFADVPHRFRACPALGGFGAGGSRLECITSPFRQWMQRRGVFRDLAEEVSSFAEQTGADVIWAFLDHPGIVAVARLLMETQERPVCLAVMDPPSYWSVEVTGSEPSQRLFAREFEYVMRHAAGCGVPSESMQEEYADRFGTRCVLLRKCVEKALWIEPRRVTTGVEDDFVIGYAGGKIYAAGVFLALLEALDEVNWRIAGRRVRLRILASGFQINRRKPACIELYGYREEGDVLSLLADCDVGFLPYWFDPFFSDSVRLCFPSKMSTYLAAGIPVFYLGPEDSSVTRFMNEHPVGVRCHARNAQAILDALERIAGGPKLRRPAVRAGQQALAKEFDMALYRERCTELIEGARA